MANNYVYGYYCLTAGEREVFCVPYVLYAHSLLSSRLLNRRGWEVIEVEIPQDYVRSFINDFFEWWEGYE